MRRPFGKKVTSGEEGAWDISLLASLLENSNHGFLKSEEEHTVVRQIRHWRNKVLHEDASKEQYDVMIWLVKSFCLIVMTDPEELASCTAKIQELEETFVVRRLLKRENERLQRQLQNEKQILTTAMQKMHQKNQAVKDKRKRRVVRYGLSTSTILGTYERDISVVHFASSCEYVLGR